jgi:hypothetical protein
MDTATSTWIRRTAFGLGLLATVAVAADHPATRSAAPARPETPAPALVIVGGEPDDEAAVDWALHRYAAAGLEDMPPLEVHLHPSDEPCRGGLGLHHAGRIDLCTMDSSEPYARKYALHEMAHAWAGANVDEQVLARFMQARGLDAWNDRTFPWKERGIEQVAEVITWGLGEGEIQPLLPEATQTCELASLYELLTGRQPITPAAVA